MNADIAKVGDKLQTLETREQDCPDSVFKFCFWMFWQTSTYKEAHLPRFRAGLHVPLEHLHVPFKLTTPEVWLQSHSWEWVTQLKTYFQLSLLVAPSTTLCLPRSSMIRWAALSSTDLFKAWILFLLHHPALPSWLHTEEDAAMPHPWPSWDAFLKRSLYFSRQ